MHGDPLAVYRGHDGRDRYPVAGCCNLAQVFIAAERQHEIDFNLSFNPRQSQCGKIFQRPSCVPVVPSTILGWLGCP